jgi:2-hydroxychromene-2-carboxylate isomerase
MRTIEFLYDFASPNAYLVHKVLPGMARKHGADVVWEPVLLGGIFKATGNQAPMHAFDGVAGKLDYQAVELQRFVHRHDLAFRMNPHFPIMTIALMRGAVFAQDKPWYARYIDCVFDAIWVDGKDMGDPAIISAALNAVDLPGDPRIRWERARDLQPDTDLGERLVVTHVPALSQTDCDQALDAGRARAEAFLAAGRITGAVLFLQGRSAVVGRAVTERLAIPEAMDV